MELDVRQSPLPILTQELPGRGAAGLGQGTAVAALVTQWQRRASLLLSDVLVLLSGTKQLMEPCP